MTYTPQGTCFAARSRFAMWLSLSAFVSACGPSLPKPAAPVASQAAQPQPPVAAPTPQQHPRVIVMVWDGLRPDSIDPQITPRLAELRDKLGVDFRDHHSVYPTFTMMNAAAIATGVRSAIHGYYGNTLYQPGPKNHIGKEGPVDYAQPVFTEDYLVLQALDAYYQKQGKALLQVQSLFELVHQEGWKTAALGKSGPAFMQDYRQDGQSGVIIDDDMVYPRAFALELQAAGFALPKRSQQQQFPEGPITLAEDNGDPTAASREAIVALDDNTTPDPRSPKGSPNNARSAYMMKLLTDYVLPKLDPALTLIWLRNPDSTQHVFGPGTPASIDALRHQDELLGQLLSTLKTLGRADSTDLLVVSDHGHSTVAADPLRFPPRELVGPPDGRAKIGERAQPGYVVSGEIRSADWLRRSGFPHTYDGNNCVLDPVLSGIKADGQPLIPSRKDLPCDPPKPAATTPKYYVPEQLEADAVIIAANGGSEYFYVPSHDPALVRKLTSTLQEREAYGPIFVRQLYGAVPGTLPLSSVGLEGPSSTSPPMPDLVVSFSWEADATSAAAPNTPGTERSSATGTRGMHGSFSPRDVHNTLIAMGPHFRAGVADLYPSSNLDIAPTVASLLRLELPQVEGRILLEALSDARERFSVEPFEELSDPVQLKRVCTDDDLECKHPQPGAEYRLHLRGHLVKWSDGSRSVRYLDQAEARRSR